MLEMNDGSTRRNVAAVAIRLLLFSFFLSTRLFFAESLRSNDVNVVESDPIRPASVETTSPTPTPTPPGNDDIYEEPELSPIRQKMMALIDACFPNTKVKSDMAKKGPAYTDGGQECPRGTLLEQWNFMGTETSCGYVAGKMLRKLYPDIWEQVEGMTYHQRTFEDTLWKGLMMGGTVNVPAFARGLSAWVEQEHGEGVVVPKTGDVFVLRNPDYPNIQIRDDATTKGCCYKEETCKATISKCEDNVVHVGIVGDVETDGERLWTTYDGGQGTPPPHKTEAARSVSRRQSFRSIEGKQLMCLPSNANGPPPSGEDASCKVIGGWIDLDKLEAYRNREGGIYRDVEPVDMMKEHRELVGSTEGAETSSDHPIHLRPEPARRTLIEENNVHHHGGIRGDGTSALQPENSPLE